MAFTPKSIKKCYTEQQQKTLLQTVMALKRPEYIRDFVYLKLLFETGIRSGAEGLTITMQSCRLEENPPKIYVAWSYSKTGVEKEILLSKVMADLLREYIKEFNSRFKTGTNGSTFIFYPGRDYDNKGNTVYHMDFQERWYYYRKKAGLDEVAYVTETGRKYRRFRLYDTRRTFIKKLRDKNPDLKLEELSMVTFHKSLDVLRNHYLEIDGEAIRKKAIFNMSQP